MIRSFALAALLITPLAQAQFVELDTGEGPFVGAGEATGRAIGFEADKNFAIDAVGINAGLRNLSFTVDIYNSTDGFDTVGDPVASEPQTLPASNSGSWNDIAIEFTFVEENFYVVHWRPTTSQDWATSWMYFSDDNLPATVGPVTVVEGMYGFSTPLTNWNNHGFFRFNVVSEPAPCPADVTGDGNINLADLNLVLASFGQSTDEGDTNNDGQVDLADLNAVLAAFGQACP